MVTCNKSRSSDQSDLGGLFRETGVIVGRCWFAFFKRRNILRFHLESWLNNTLLLASCFLICLFNSVCRGGAWCKKEFLSWLDLEPLAFLGHKPPSVTGNHFHLYRVALCTISTSMIMLNNFVSSVRSSNSHPDLLVITTSLTHFLSPSGDLGIGLVWHNLSPPRLFGRTVEILFKVN